MIFLHIAVLLLAPKNTASLGVSWDWNKWWTYDGISGPNFWGLINPEWSLCTQGRRQSPVNIDPTLLLFDPNLRPLHIDKHGVSGTLNNTGHGVVFTLDGEGPPLWTRPVGQKQVTQMRGYGGQDGGKRRKRGTGEKGKQRKGTKTHRKSKKKTKKLSKKSSTTRKQSSQRAENVRFDGRTREQFNDQSSNNKTKIKINNNSSVKKISMNLNAVNDVKIKVGAPDNSLTSMSSQNEIHAKLIRKRDVGSNLYGNAIYSNTWNIDSFGGFSNFADQNQNLKNSASRMEMHYNSTTYGSQEDSYDIDGSEGIIADVDQNNDLIDVMHKRKLTEWHNQKEYEGTSKSKRYYHINKGIKSKKNIEDDSIKNLNKFDKFENTENTTSNIAAITAEHDP
ncbi:uncharacterized protein LOC125179591 [Hyalella azteca]|uniref:Uncharacterized protein LOC125179591 n=1 Tax=Hyalella azteca TaxID=294128 RepID=A0A979FY06_HYAAZ|nr:uncharacterized protein LOC125179591 [Hyalella azteca]